PCLSLHSTAPPPHLPSFPTRRSSDLVLEQREVAAAHLEQLRTDGVPVGRHRVRYAAARKATRPSAPPNARTRGGNTRLGPVEYRSEEHTSELQSRGHLVCRLLLEKKK